MWIYLNFNDVNFCFTLVRPSVTTTHTTPPEECIYCILAFVHARARPHIVEHFTVFHSLHCRCFDDDNDKATMRFDRAAPSPNEVTRKIHRRVYVFVPVPKTVEEMRAKKKNRNQTRARFVEAENHAVTAATSLALAIAIVRMARGRTKKTAATHKYIKTSFGTASADCRLEQTRDRNAVDQQQWNQIIRATQIC